MIDRYSFDDWLNYGRRGKREYSCFRFYSVGLNRGMPLVILDALKKIGFGGIFVWLPTLFAEKLLTDGKFPLILDYLGIYATRELFTFSLIVTCLVAIWIAAHSIRQGFRYVNVLDELQSLNYQVENQTQNPDVNLRELATVCCDGVASCFSIFRPKDGIGCAIRLARPGKSDHEVGYATVARGGVSPRPFRHHLYCESAPPPTRPNIAVRHRQ